MSPPIRVLASAFKDPETAARRLSDVVQQLQEQIAASQVNRRLIENFTFTTKNPVGGTFPLVIPNIGFAVKGVVIVKFGLVDRSLVAFPGGLAWSARPDGSIQIDFISGLGVSLSYVMNLEVIGG